VSVFATEHVTLNLRGHSNEEEDTARPAAGDFQAATDPEHETTGVARRNAAVGKHEFARGGMANPQSVGL